MMSGIKDLQNELAVKRGITHTEAKSILEDVLSVMESAIVDGGIQIRGVFTIKPKVQKARSGSFQGKEWHSEAKTTLSIACGSDLEAELNHKG